MHQVGLGGRRGTNDDVKPTYPSPLSASVALSSKDVKSRDENESGLCFVRRIRTSSV